MARKSRKADRMGTDEKKIGSGVYLVGFYVRLSEKEIQNGGAYSESIEGQQRLLAEFVRDRPEFRWVSTFIDDGKTGTNFDRDGFGQMMEEIKKGKINCVMVKDLSRLGRNYLETGHYLEHVFPFLGVRFLSVSDGFDTLTASPSQLAYLVPLKNMMHEYYARDISRKERTAKKVLRKKGCFLGPYAKYGYERARDGHRICVDPEAAVHVKEIFNLCEQGYSDRFIARRLNQNKIPSPARYKYEKGILHDEKYARASRWHPQTVASILTSRIYLGDLVQGRQRNREIKGKKKVMPREEWDVVSGCHEPIITEGQFRRVQEIRSARRR